MDSANNHPYKMAIVNDDDFYANNHPYKVKIVEGGGISAKVVDELPETGESGYIYLVLKEETEEGDIYDEWIWAEKDGEFTWEHLGATNEVTITLYDTTGQNTDGAMTQKAVTDALEDVEEIANSKAASVNGDGDSWVREASQIHTDTTQSQSDMFIFRTTAGSLSISTGEATLYYIGGNTVKSGYSDEVLELTGEFDNPETTAEIDADTWRTQVATSGDYEFAYDGEWKLSGSSVNLGDYGITVTGGVSEGDSITVGYQAQVIGTLTTAKPTSFVATGFNQYNSTAGYAHVVGGQEYRIDGTYTSLEFATEVGGTTTQITVDENSKFVPEDDGYISVNGASGDILIALVWSGIMDSEPFSEYETSTITIPTVDVNGENLPTATYGMPSIGDVHDRMNLSEKVYTQNIGHYPYSAENLATVKAMGVDYIYDLTDIFYVLEEPIQYTLPETTEAGYIANDFGTEEFVGTDVPVRAGLVYGNNLVDKLRNILDIQSLGEGLSLNGSELSAASCFKKIITFRNSSALTNGYYCFMETEPGWYLVDGDLSSESRTWDLRLGTNGQRTANAIWSNSFFDHQYIILCKGETNTAGVYQYEIYPDKRDATYWYTGSNSTNTNLFRGRRLAIGSYWGQNPDSNGNLVGNIISGRTINGQQFLVGNGNRSANNSSEFLIANVGGTIGLSKKVQGSSASGGELYSLDIDVGKVQLSHTYWNGTTPTVPTLTLAGVTDPTNPQDAATKNYCDNLVAGVATQAFPNSTFNTILGGV